MTITCWAFTNTPVSAENRLLKIMNAVRTPIPCVLQADQRTCSPSDRPSPC